MKYKKAFSDIVKYTLLFIFFNMVVRYRTNIFRQQEFKLFCLLIIVSTFFSSFIYMYRRHPRNIHIKQAPQLGVHRVVHTRQKQAPNVHAFAPPDHILTDKLNLMKNICRTIPPGKYVDWKKLPTFYLAPDLHLSYCIVRSDKDEIWKRIFQLIRHATSNTLSNITETLTKNVAYLGIKEKVPYKSRLRRASQTVLSVQSPYQRLFLAYYDRFYVEHQTCEPLLFQEFLDKIISGVKLRLAWGTALMSPLIPKCRLCDVKPFDIVKDETFTEDMGHFVNRLNLGVNVTDAVEAFLGHTKLLIPAILHSKLKLHFLDICTSLAKNLGQRLWKSFQITGLISKGLDYPASLGALDVSKNIDMFTDAAIYASELEPLSGDQRRTQIQEALVEAYAGIKNETINYIQEIYKYDFEMFGYSDQRPS